MTNELTLLPWEQLPDVWKTKAQYFQWLRGQMRKAWSRHPVKVAYTKSRRVRAAVGKKRDKLTGVRQTVWALPCDQCKRVFPQGDVEVDHIVQAGSFRDWSDVERWLKGLMLINFASLQLLCKPCHRIKSYAETHDLTFEDAEAEKAGIAWLKENSPNAQQNYLLDRGYTPKEIGNAKLRRACYVQYYKANG